MGEPTVCEGPRYLHSQTRSPCTRGPSLDAALGLRDKPQGRGRAVRALGTRGGGLGPPGRPASRVFSGEEGRALAPHTSLRGPWGTSWRLPGV